MSVEDAPWNQPVSEAPPDDEEAITEIPPESINPEALQSLYRAALDNGDLDRAWCAAAALAFIELADEDQLAFHERHRPTNLPLAAGRLDALVWSKWLLHPDQDPVVGKLLELVTAPTTQLQLGALSQRGELPTVDARCRQDPDATTITLAKVFFWSATVLGVHRPELYVLPDMQGGLTILWRAPLTSLAGQRAMTGVGPQELAFLCGHHLAAYWGHNYLQAVLEPAELALTCHAARRIANPAAKLAIPRPEVVDDRAAELVRLLQPEQLETLQAVERQLVSDPPPDLAKWWRAVEMTRCRAGLLLCGDLGVAKRVLDEMPIRPGAPAVAQMIHDLVGFSVSSEYLQLRRQLGIAVGSDATREEGIPAQHEWARTIDALGSRRGTSHDDRTDAGATPGDSGRALLIVAAVVVLVVVAAIALLAGGN